MFRQQGKDDEREPVIRPLPPDITAKLAVSPAAIAETGPRRLPAHSRDERRLARIDRKVAERERNTD